MTKEIQDVLREGKNMTSVGDELPEVLKSLNLGKMKDQETLQEFLKYAENTKKVEKQYWVKLQEYWVKLQSLKTKILEHEDRRFYLLSFLDKEKSYKIAKDSVVQEFKIGQQIEQQIEQQIKQFKKNQRISNLGLTKQLDLLNAFNTKWAEKQQQFDKREVLRKLQGRSMFT